MLHFTLVLVPGFAKEKHKVQYFLGYSKSSQLHPDHRSYSISPLSVLSLYFYSFIAMLKTIEMEA